MKPAPGGMSPMGTTSGARTDQTSRPRSGGCLAPAGRIAPIRAGESAGVLRAATPTAISLSLSEEWRVGSGE